MIGDCKKTVDNMKKSSQMIVDSRQSTRKFTESRTENEFDNG